MAIHPTAVIDPSAEIASSVDIGAYCIIESGVRVGPETRLWPHAYVCTGTTIGSRCQIHPFAIVGHHPQDLAWQANPSYTDIGDETVIREHAQVHRGTMPESRTIIGKRCYLMSVSHIGHNCRLGDDVKVATNSALAGHVSVGDKTFISGNSAVHQFVRIGELAMISGCLRVENDVPSFMMLGPLGVVGTNVIGLRRAGLSPAVRNEIRTAYKTLYRSGLAFREAIRRVAEQVRSEPARRLVAFLQGVSKRGYERFRGSQTSSESELLELSERADSIE